MRLEHGARVSGMLNGVAYRSSLMEYGGVFHLGVHKGTAEAASVATGDSASVDRRARSRAAADRRRATQLGRRARSGRSGVRVLEEARACLQTRLRPKSALDAKKAETRVRRIAGIVGALHDGLP